MAEKRRAPRPAFSFFICPDSWLARQKADELLAQYPPSQGSWQKKIFWGDEEPSGSFFEHFDGGGFFATSTCLLVYAAELWKPKIWEKINTMLARLSPYCWPMFCLETEWSRGAPKLSATLAKTACLLKAEKKGWIWRDPGLTQSTVQRYVLERAQALHLHLPEDLLRDLAASSPLEARSIEQELNKLALYYAEKDRLEAREWQRPVREEDIFSLLRQIQSGNLQGVLKALATLSEPEKIFFTLLVLLDRQIRSLWQNKTGFGKTGACGYSLALLAEAMSVLVDMEWKVKQGYIAQVPKALEQLAIELTRLFSRKSL
ncbi:MAG: DNA polymerase III subunit delta [Desulfovibrio sp.]|nr:DNA polymerase III subunit delta [Desulfovibrio sp.]